MDQGTNFYPQNTGVTQSSVSNRKGSKRFIVIFTVIFLLILSGVGGYLLAGLTKEMPGLSVGVNQKTIPEGLVKAQSLLADYPSLVNRSGVQIVYNGTILSYEPGVKWTIESEGKSLTVINEKKSTVNHFRAGGSQGVAPTSIGTTDLKPGDEVAILSLVDLETGTETITSVMVSPATSLPQGN